jgi:hypothetical protein
MLMLVWASAIPATAMIARERANTLQSFAQFMVESPKEIQVKVKAKPLPVRLHVVLGRIPAPSPTSIGRPPHVIAAKRLPAENALPLSTSFLATSKNHRCE